jgi:hypothetical protein
VTTFPSVVPHAGDVVGDEVLVLHDEHPATGERSGCVGVLSIDRLFA